MKHKESRIDAPLGGAESNAPKKKGKRVWWIVEALSHTLTT